MQENSEKEIKVLQKLLFKENIVFHGLKTKSFVEETKEARTTPYGKD